MCGVLMTCDTNMFAVEWNEAGGLVFIIELCRGVGYIQIGSGSSHQKTYKCSITEGVCVWQGVGDCDEFAVAERQP